MNNTYLLSTSSHKVIGYMMMLNKIDKYMAMQEKRNKVRNTRMVMESINKKVNHEKT